MLLRTKPCVIFLFSLFSIRHYSFYIPILDLAVVFSLFLTLMMFEFFSFSHVKKFRNIAQSLSACVLPALVFKVLLITTDHHLNRVAEPENVNMLISNAGSLLLSPVSPFKNSLFTILQTTYSNFEGCAYLVFGRKLHFRRCVKKNNRSFTPVNLTIIFFNTPRN